MNPQKIQVLLADDDLDDRLLFKKALEELPLCTNLVTVNGGEELMELLQNKTGNDPALLFLDLNMPGVNGFQCLTHINRANKSTGLLTIVLSGSVDQTLLPLLHLNGAVRYIRKPIEFAKLKQVIYNAIYELSSSKPENHEFLFQF